MHRERSCVLVEEALTQPCLRFALMRGRRHRKISISIIQLAPLCACSSCPAAPAQLLARALPAQLAPAPC